jgi:APA family basic amino acid/polyamine antiporter
MEQIVGAPGVVIIAVALMISTFGCNNGLILSGSRVSYAMAKDGYLFAPLARTNDKHVPQWLCSRRAYGLVCSFCRAP